MIHFQAKLGASSGISECISLDQCKVGYISIKKRQPATQGYSVIPNMPGNKPKGHQKLGAVLKLLEKTPVLLLS